MFNLQHLPKWVREQFYLRVEGQELYIDDTVALIMDSVINVDNRTTSCTLYTKTCAVRLFGFPKRIFVVIA